MGLGIAEVDQKAVSHVARDVTFVAGDAPGATHQEGADNIAQVLGVKTL